jgi:integrase/recombinase XerD
MKRLSEFLNTQHNVSKSAKLSYRAAILAFDRLSGVEFEDGFLDQVLVHEALNRLQDEYAEQTWNHYLVCLKRYAKWLSDPDDETLPKFWKRIKPVSVDTEKLLKDKWLTEEEFSRIIEVTDSTRDRAMFGVCLEGALRAGELLGLKVRDVKVNSYGFDVIVSGKTGSGSFPVVLFAPLLKQWLNIHPCKNDVDAPLWLRRGTFQGYQPIKTGALDYNFNKYAQRAKINRHVSIHILRHTKITWTAKSNDIGVSDEMAKKMFRWKQSSRMYGRYTHLHGADSTKTYLALAGVKESREEKPSLLVKRKCLNCNEENSMDAMYCNRCGTVLDQEQALRIVKEREMMNYFMKRYMEEQGKKSGR